MSVDIEKLEALAKAATPGPWETETYVVYARNERGNLFPVAETILPIDFDHTYTAHKKDAAYITAACNAVPELIARVRELEKALIEVVKLEVPLPECAVCWDKDKCADRTHGDNCLTIQDIINVAKEAVRTNKQ